MAEREPALERLRRVRSDPAEADPRRACSRRSRAARAAPRPPTETPSAFASAPWTTARLSVALRRRPRGRERERGSRSVSRGASAASRRPQDVDARRAPGASLRTVSQASSSTAHRRHRPMGVGDGDTVQRADRPASALSTSSPSASSPSSGRRRAGTRARRSGRSGRSAGRSRRAGAPSRARPHRVPERLTSASAAAGRRAARAGPRPRRRRSRAGRRR